MNWKAVKVFSATKSREREGLGQRVTEWLRGDPSIRVDDRVIRQSSDHEYHCVSIVIFYHKEGRKICRAKAFKSGSKKI